MSLVVKEKPTNRVTEQNLKSDLYMQMVAAEKEKVKLSFRLKNRMPKTLRHELQNQLETLNKKERLLQEIWQQLSKAGNPKLAKLLNELKNEAYEKYPGTEVLDLALYNSNLKRFSNQLIDRLNQDYNLFFGKFDFKDHLSHKKNKKFKSEYIAALYTIAHYFGLQNTDIIQIIAKKINVTVDMKLVAFEKIEKVCAPKWILNAHTIDRESWNIFLLAESLLIIPVIINNKMDLDEQLLHSLRLSDKEARDIIDFTNLLKADALQATKPFLQIEKYEVLKFYYMQFEKFAYKEIDMNTRILVIGTMSSGKSTFLNSLIGQDLFPSKNEACTARIFEYAIKKAGNYTVYQDASSQPEVLEQLSQETVEKWNAIASQKPLLIHGPSKATVEVDKKITLIDTPGPNNSADKDHREVMKQALSGDYDKIFYILNSTQLGTEDDVHLLNTVQELLSKKSNLLIYFIVNKVDEFENNDNESIATLKKSVVAYIQAKGFTQPNIIFVSALTAKLVQNEVNSQALSRKERNQLRFFYEIMSEPEYDLTKYALYSERKVPNRIRFNENLTEQQKKLLIHSGITEVLNCL
ncbi:MAG: dynamin family protein [Solibacillus sp.]